jgi:hypothetical protein
MGHVGVGRGCMTSQCIVAATLVAMSVGKMSTSASRYDLELQCAANRICQQHELGLQWPLNDGAACFHFTHLVTWV